MKKEVQALIKRRRARVIPAILLAFAGIIIVGIVLLVVAAVTNGPGLGVVRTATVTITVTSTVTPTATTPAPTETPTETPTVTETAGPSPTPTQVIHVVEEGENLFTIAEIYRANVCLIMAINNIVDASFLSVGQSLIIPPADFELPTSTPFPADIPRATVVTYVVQCGDTLDSIAALFNSTGDDISDRNDIADDTELQIGQVIEVRVNIATPTPTATFTVTPAETAAPAATETPTP